MSEPRRPSLSVTALYTSDVWRQAGFPCAELYASSGARDVRRVVDLVLAVAGCFRRRRPSLRAALVHRHAFLDAVIAEARPAMVLELAAGLSPRGAALSVDPGLEVVEVDLPELIADKEALLARTEEGRAVLARPNLRRVAADLRARPLRELATASGPAVVIIEGLLMYLPLAARRDLWSQAAAWLKPHGGVLAFDLVPGPEEPEAGWIGRLLGALMRRATGGQGMLRDGLTRAELVGELLAAGFDEAEAVEPGAVAAERQLPMAGHPSVQVVFTARVRA